MAKARTFTIRIVGDAKDAQRALQSIGNSAKGLSGSFKPATAGLGKLFAATLSFAAIGGIVRGLGSLAYAASDLGEVQSKVNQIFGESARQLDAWSQGSAKAFGQSRTQALNAASTFGVFGKSAGLTGTELINFSTDLTELAADMASFNNTTIDEAILALGSGLRGENEPLRRFGILLDDATLRMEALKLGLISNTKEALTPQQKVLAATSAIYAQTSDQQGDFARTADGAANQTRILVAQFEDMKTEIGQALLPVLSALLGFTTDLIDAFKEGGLGGAIKMVSDEFLNFTTNGGTAAEVVSGLLAILAGAAAAWLIYSAATTVATIATLGLSAAIASIPVIGQIAVIIGLIIAAFTYLILKSQGFRDIMKVVWNAIVEFVETSLNIVLGALELLANGFIDAINLLIKAYNKIPFLDNVDELDHVNWAVDLTGAKFATAANSVNDFATSTQRATYFSSLLTNELSALAGIPAIAPYVEPPKVDKPYPTPSGKEESAVERFFKAMREGADKAAEAFRDLRDDIAKSISGLLDLGDAFDIGGGKGMVRAFTQQGKDILNYAKNLATLQREGLGQPALQQILGMNLSDGAAIAQSLVDGGIKDIRQINRVFGQVAQAGMELGTQFATAVNPYGAQIAAQQDVTNQTVNNTFNVVVNSNDPNAVVNALRKYQRQNGAIPIRTTGTA